MIVMKKIKVKKQLKKKSLLFNWSITFLPENFYKFANLFLNFKHNNSELAHKKIRSLWTGKEVSLTYLRENSHKKIFETQTEIIDP